MLSYSKVCSWVKWFSQFSFRTLIFFLADGQSYAGAALLGLVSSAEMAVIILIELK